MKFLTWQCPGQLFVAQDFIPFNLLQVCGIKVNEDYETSENLEFNFTIEPNAECVLNNDVVLYLSISNPSPNYDDNDLDIVCGPPYNTGSISKNEIKNLGYKSGEPIYISLWVEFKDGEGFCPAVYVYSDVIETSFTFEEEEE